MRLKTHTQAMLSSNKATTAKPNHSLGLLAIFCLRRRSSAAEWVNMVMISILLKVQN
ncbi:hypothetical protein SALWKB29_1979 [Snodgrassella communis]|uniref:Uncharacterized protein n=1 Tax=Snodgrassella communis TaxID=2946699 RepID=A0A836Z2L3_9NEIS|nr:hypothetical protein SALWKB29_1979 [Snodgrassella communis]